jgi:hypothetical protein
MIENEQKTKTNLVIWLDFIWLFGVLLFGYLAFYSLQLLESSLCAF